MNIEVSDSALVDDLAEAIRLRGFAVVRVGSNSLYVGLSASQRGADALPGSTVLELDLLLGAWEAKNRGAHAARTG
jgi:hypothetical protein